MSQLTEIIQKRFDGFLHTNSLWENNTVYGLKQFDIEQQSIKFNAAINEKLRLGKYVERFVSYQLEQESTIDIIAENIQIQQNKRTIGELDCILLDNKKPIHLEVIYKYYLYDYSSGNSEIEHFVGPNRKDALVEKLKKLKEKQLPLLYSKQCLEYLESIDIKASEIEQYVYFKAQLFIPYNTSLVLNQLNQDCIVGFYIYEKELDVFKEAKFFIPYKKDWLQQPHKNVDWLTFGNFKETIANYLLRKFSPLIWLKKPNGEIYKCFVVWW